MMHSVLPTGLDDRCIRTRSFKSPSRFTPSHCLPRSSRTSPPKAVVARRRSRPRLLVPLYYQDGKGATRNTARTRTTSSSSRSLKPWRISDWPEGCLLRIRWRRPTSIRSSSILLSVSRCRHVLSNSVLIVCSCGAASVGERQQGDCRADQAVHRDLSLSLLAREDRAGYVDLYIYDISRLPAQGQPSELLAPSLSVNRERK